MWNKNLFLARILEGHPYVVKLSKVENNIILSLTIELSPKLIEDFLNVKDQTNITSV